MIKLDYSIQSPEERLSLVEQILKENSSLSSSYLEYLADYLIMCMEKQEKKQKKFLTNNRIITINKRETSFEGLANQFENGENGIYNLIKEDKNSLLCPKVSITKKDLENYPFLAQLRREIDIWDKARKKTTGKQNYIMKKAIIEMRKDQYIIKQSYERPVISNKLLHSTAYFDFIPIDDESYLNDNNEIIIQGFSLMNPKVVETVLVNYSKLRQDNYDKFYGDIWYLMLDFDNLCDKAIKDKEIYQIILENKIDGKTNEQIKKKINNECNKKYSEEYISNIWRNKIPQCIAQQAQDDFIIEEYNKNNKPFKTCTKCFQAKPQHNNFFSKNNTSKDGLYSICKKCRSVLQKRRKKNAE